MAYRQNQGHYNIECPWAELMKAGGETMVATLTKLYNKVWNTETVPADVKTV